MAASNVTVKRGREQFQGIFSEMWFAAGNINFPEILDGDEGVDTVAVPGIKLGDMIIAMSIDTDVADLGITANVTADNEVTVQVWNNTGGAPNIDEGRVRLVIGRPMF